nr:hypothetical protein [Staphylococcus pseudintermedius]
MKVSELHAHFAQYFSRITKNCLMVHINLKQFEKFKFPNQMGKCVLGIPVARDRVIQQAIRQVIEPGIDRTFSNHISDLIVAQEQHLSNAAYYEEGYKIAVDCDLKQCFDMLNHDNR